LALVKKRYSPSHPVGIFRAMAKIEIKAGPLIGADADEKYTVAIDDDPGVTYWIDQTEVDAAAYTAAILTEILRKLENKPAGR
jgi:hypothetical protein